ncbi:MAG: SDR family oxidoreductase [Pirellulaceae bacterium]|nr:SDR family oxidoreductase [Pirellulaceae bacterium]
MVTGASGYLGSALARALAEAGSSVVASSRDLATARQTAAALPVRGDARHHGVAIDQLDERSIEQGFAAAVEQAGRVDVLVNNGHSPIGSDWTTVSGSEFSKQLENATGYFLLARHVHQHAVRHARGASVIMLGSMYGVVGSYPEAYAGVCAASPVAYHALKGGIVHLTRHLAVYWAREGVRVNCLSPGPFPDSSRVPDGLVPRLVARSPMGRMGVPEELKGAVVFLASDASSYMTGQNLVIDGGWTAW